MGTPEKKILLALCYYVLVMLLAIPAFMLETRRAELFEAELRNYFLCEEQGVNPANPGLCDKFRDSYRALSTPELSTVAFILLNLIPTVILIYTVDFMESKEKWMKLKTMCTTAKYISHSEKTAETTTNDHEQHTV